MKTSLLFILAFAVTVSSAIAQVTPADSVKKTQPEPVVTQPTPTTEKTKSDQRPVMNRISLGGSTGFWIKPSQTYLELSALLAYRFPKILTMGPGYRYIYRRDRTFGKNLNTYGPNVFARAQLTKRIYLWTEWEYLKTEYYGILPNDDYAIQTDHAESFFGGLGYIRQIGRKGRGGISMQVLYNFLYDREVNSPYYSPVTYRVGYFF